MKKYLKSKEPELNSAFTHKYSGTENEANKEKKALSTERHQRILQEYYEHKRISENQLRKDTEFPTNETLEYTNSVIEEFSERAMTFGQAQNSSIGENTIPNTEKELKDGVQSIKDLKKILQEVNMFQDQTSEGNEHLEKGNESNYLIDVQGQVKDRHHSLTNREKDKGLTDSESTANLGVQFIHLNQKSASQS